MKWYFLTVSFIQVLCVIVLLVDRKNFTKYSQWAVIVLIGGFFAIWVGAIAQVVAHLVL